MKTLPDNSIFEQLGKKQQTPNHPAENTGEKSRRVAIYMPVPEESRFPLQVRRLFYGVFNRTYCYHQNPVYDRIGVEFVLEGTLAVRLPDRSILIEPGEIFLIMPGMEITLTAGPEGFCRKYSFPVTGEALSVVLRSLQLTPEKMIRSRIDCSSMLRICKQLCSSSGEDSRENSLLAYQLLMLLAEEKPDLSPPPKFESVRKRMIQEYNHSFSIKELAACAGCSESLFARTFRKIYGMTPHQMLISIRMSAAKKMLLEFPSLQIKEIAEKTGYANAMNFSTAFRSVYHVSPRQFRLDRIQNCFNH